jgi:type I restriction enzyme S subunit
MKEGWEILDFEKCLEKVTYTRKIKRKEFKENGVYPVISQEQGEVNGYWDNEEDLFTVDRPVIIFGDHTQVLKYIDYSFVLGADGVKILRTKNDIDPRYFYYFLKNIDLGNLGYARHYRLLKEVKVSYPKSLPEQQRIVSILDRAFAAIAKAKANAEQNLQNAKELFESYLQGVFENADWETRTIQEITRVINGYAFKSKDFKPTNSIKSVKITNVGVKEFVEETDNYLPEAFGETLNKVQVKEGDIVIALTRTIISAGLKVAVVPSTYDGALVNQRVAALVANEENVNPSYLYYFLTTKGVADYVLAHVNTLMQPNLSINDLKTLPVPLPSTDEQESIVRHLDAMQCKTQELEAVYQQKLDDFEELKKSILKKAFAGELGTETLETA